MVELAALEGKSQPEIVALIEAQSQHFAVLKFNILKGGLGYLDQAKITVCKLAFHKSDFRKVCIGKFALFKNTVLIFPFRQWVILKIYFVECFSFYVSGRHQFLFLICCKVNRMRQYPAGIYPSVFSCWAGFLTANVPETSHSQAFVFNLHQNWKLFVKKLPKPSPG